MSSNQMPSSSTVAGQERQGNSVASNTTMSAGKNTKMNHKGFLGSGATTGLPQFVLAGTPGPNNGATGVNGTVTGSKAVVPGRGAAVLSTDGKMMGTGKGGSARKNSHPGFL